MTHPLKIHELELADQQWSDLIGLISARSKFSDNVIPHTIVIVTVTMRFGTKMEKGDIAPSIYAKCT